MYIITDNLLLLLLLLFILLLLLVVVVVVVVFFFYLSDEVFADRIPYCSKCEGVVKPGEFSNTSQGGGIKAQIIVTLIP